MIIPILSNIDGEIAGNINISEEMNKLLVKELVEISFCYNKKDNKIINFYLTPKKNE